MKTQISEWQKYFLLRCSVLLLIASCSSVQEQSIFDQPEDPVREAVLSKDMAKLRTLLDGGTDYDLITDGSQPIHVAAQSGNLEAMTLLKDAGAKIDIRDAMGNEPIHLAAIAESVPAVEWLLKQGIAPDVRNATGETPTQFLIRLGRSATIGSLIQGGADVNYTDASGDTLLHKAVEAVNPDAIGNLLPLGADPDVLNNKGLLPIHRSAQLSKQEDILSLFKEQGIDLNQVDASGDTPIHISIKSLSPSSLEKLLELGADSSIPDHRGIDVMHLAARVNNPAAIEVLHRHGVDLMEYNPQGFAPLHAAVVQRRKKVLEKLLELGADIEQPVQGKGVTALHLSARVGYVDIQRVLEGYGANIYAKDKAGNTVIHYAARFDKPKSIQEAVKKGGDANNQNLRLETPIHVAILAQSNGALRTLLKEGVDLSIRDATGDQPLHLALALDQTEDVAQLLKSKADPNVVNGQRQTPLVQSIHGGDIRNMAELLKNGAKVDAVDSAGWYPLHRAAQLGNAKAVIVLARAKHPLYTLTPEGDTALHIATKERQVLAVRALARVGASLDVRNTSGNTPLHSAVVSNQTASINELLDLGAKVTERDNDGLTPLLRAVVNNKPDSVAQLMGRAPESQRDLFGNTPVLLAMGQEDDAMTTLVLRLGGSASGANFAGKRPLPEALKAQKYNIAAALVSHGADVTEPLDNQGMTACDVTTDSDWHNTCLGYFRDETYLAARQRWINIGQPRQYTFSKWRQRIPKVPQAKGEPIAAIRGEADRGMRFYLAFSSPDDYLSEILPPVEDDYDIEQLRNESDASYKERLDYIKTTYQQSYQKKLEQYTRRKQERLETLAAFRQYRGDELPSRQRVAMDLNADAIMAHLRTPLQAISIDYNLHEGVLRANLANDTGLRIDLALSDKVYKAYTGYIARHGKEVPWYIGATVGVESFSITHVIVPSPDGHIYLPLAEDEYKYLLQRFLSLRGAKTFLPDE